MNAPDLQAFADAYPIDIGPPTDDSPFFFNMLRLRDIFNSRLMALLVVLLIFGFVTTPIAAALGGASTPVRIAASVALLFPAGVFMGMAFPLGMTVAANRTPHSAPWLWGVNGATSVLASVLAMVIALAAGISAAFWTGVVCYALALVAYRKAVPVT